MSPIGIVQEKKHQVIFGGLQMDIILAHQTETFPKSQYICHVCVRARQRKKTWKFATKSFKFKGDEPLFFSGQWTDGQTDG